MQVIIPLLFIRNHDLEDLAGIGNIRRYGFLPHIKRYGIPATIIKEVYGYLGLG
jgi:hypothetical protein